MSVDRTAYVVSAKQRERATRATWWLMYGACIASTLVLGAIGYTADVLSFALFLTIAGVTLCLLRPAIGVQFVVFFTVLGDGNTWPAYPFIKNFSSAESILFVSGALKFSPLELCLMALMAGWGLTMIGQNRRKIRRTPLNRALLLYCMFIVTGFAWGMAKGGSWYIALWEFRGMLCLPIMFFVMVNVFHTQKQYARAFALVAAATVINSFIALGVLAAMTSMERDAIESLVDHGAALPMNLVFVLLMASLVFRGASRRRKWALVAVTAPVLVAYLASQRRSGFVGLAGALILLAVALRWMRPRTFRRALPIVVLAAVGFLGATWNATGFVGFPAQSVKSVVAPDQLNSADKDSDFYRVIETADLNFTIRSAPIMGVGFGNPFLRPYPLPAIETFVLAAYMSHNAALWIWIKLGFFGFVTVIYLFATAMRHGARNTWTVREDTDRAVLTLAATCYVLMYAIFCYVDISWDPRNMVIVGLCFAQIVSIPHLRPPAEVPVESELPVAELVDA